ncbi:MetQ/NlpA family ABC transporter substrate-binding protein [Scrofimicrobium sp. R131]|uniref:Lipoprotein n=1 Tax=Scrofimicrobium appendicitidis TaxID=3079930 RepID=A0AAU7V6J3_9ACTO
MRKIRNFALIGAAGALALAGCSTGTSDQSTDQSADQSTSQSDAAASGETVTLTVGASPSPHAVILQYVQDNLAADAGLDLKIVEYTDYVQPNEALAAGDLDANYFQTIPYLEEESEARGYDFVAGEGIHLEPLAIYSDKIESLDDLPEGAKIGIINDPTNQGRALALLAENGLVELPASGDVNVNTVTKKKDFTFVETEGAQLGRSLADVDIAVINGNFAQEAGLAPADSLAIESTENNPALNVLVWAKGSPKEDSIKKLDELLHSPEVAEFIQQQWPDGSVIPAA